MDDMSGLLSQNFGIRPQGKSAPMAASKTASTNRSVPSSTSWTNQPADSFDDLFNPTASSPPSSSANNRSTTVNQSHDPILDTFNKGPVFDTPVYDDEDIFNGVPGIRSSSNLKYDDVFVSGSSDRGRVTSPPPYDDLLGSLGRGSGASDRQHGVQSPQAYDDLLGGLGTGKGMGGKHRGSAEAKDSGLSGFEDLLPGFGSSSAAPQPKREVPETDLPKPPKPPTADPFFVVGTGTSTGSFTDPLDHFAKPEPTKMDTSSPTTDNFFSENPNSFDSMPSFQSPGSSFRETNVPLQSNKTRDSSPINANNQSSFDDFENISIGKSKFAAEEQSPEPSEHSETGDDIWLTVSEIPLFTKPTNAPPPSRPPPSLSSSKQKFKGNYSYQKDEEFGFDDGEMERSSAAMKDAMSKAELKFKHAKEVREKMAKSKEAEQQEREDEEIEKQEREREEREKERRRIEEEKRRVEKQERDRGKQAVERATREARERASSDAILKSQRAAVLRAQQEARERAGQDARDRVAHEAKEREKAEREAKERAEREREAKERAERAERERKMQRAAVEKAASEARERLAQAAKEKHQQNQRKSEPTPSPAKVPPPPAKVPPPPAAQDDFDSIFGMGGSGPRPTSVPKRNPTPQESQAQNRPTSASANIRKTSSTNMMDDLSAIFGGAPSSSGEFQEIDGETEDRRKARFEREMRTRDRAIKALAEKNARDMQVQHEQNERSRIGETLDFEIKRWAAGKEGNLRSLLSSLHYILWPECGWQPVSMADLITGASVKKVYRKATLCIHPDKVQQKGATLQQKYISEKVFDILKEAWNKFNSEELF